jgi:hypothetical protein
MLGFAVMSRPTGNDPDCGVMDSHGTLACAL